MALFAALPKAMCTVEVVPDPRTLHGDTHLGPPLGITQPFDRLQPRIEQCRCQVYA